MLMPELGFDLLAAAFEHMHRHLGFIAVFQLVTGASLHSFAISSAGNSLIP